MALSATLRRTRDLAQPHRGAARRASALLLTGASGFLGKAVLARPVRELPETASPGAAARRRRRRARCLATRCSPAHPFEGLGGERALAMAIGGDLAAICSATWPQRAVAARASTSSSTAPRPSPSSSRSTRRSSSTARARRDLLEALREAGSDPYFVHVSTAYAAGQRTGLVLERPSGTAPGRARLDLDAELDAARAWRRDSSPSRACPMHQHRFVDEAERAVGPAGGPAIGARAEQLRHDWVRDAAHRARPRARPRARLDRHLRALQGDRRAHAAWPSGPRQLTIVRPTIVESALHTPYPGWMESLKVADPILLGYGAGLIPGRFAANRSIRMDIVPVDFVANACLAAAAHPPERRRAHDERGQRHAQPADDRRHGRDHQRATSASARSRTRTACRSTCRSGG